MNGYEEIMHLSRPVSETHSKMPIADRAAQFSSFAALTGYDAAVAETARYTEEKIELDDSAKALLDRMLQRLCRGDRVKVTWFRPDLRKEGGAYLTASTEYLGVDRIAGILRFSCGEIPVDALYQLEL